MNSAIKNFALVSLAVLLSLVLVWFYLRGKALSETPPTPHPSVFLNGAPSGGPEVIAYRGGSGERPENTWLAFDHAASLSPHLILWADIRPTKDGVLVAFYGKELATTTSGSGWVGYTDFADIAKLNPAVKFQNEEGQFPYRDVQTQIPTLKELLERYPQHRFILNFSDYKPGIETRIIAVIDEAKAGSRVLIQSEESGLLKDLREKKPEWLFGTSQAQIIQMRMLEAVGLEALAPLKGDVYITEVSKGRRVLLSPAVIKEIKRRHMKIFAGPVDSREEALRLHDLGVDGIIATQPSELAEEPIRH